MARRLRHAAGGVGEAVRRGPAPLRGAQEADRGGSQGGRRGRGRDACDLLVHPGGDRRRGRRHAGLRRGARRAAREADRRGLTEPVRPARRDEGAAPINGTAPSSWSGRVGEVRGIVAPHLEGSGRRRRCREVERAAGRRVDPRPRQHRRELRVLRQLEHGLGAVDPGGLVPGHRLVLDGAPLHDHEPLARMGLAERIDAGE